MTQRTARVPLQGDMFTQEALDGLVGQTPRVNLGMDYTKPIGRATVVKAEQEGDFLVLTIDLDEQTTARLVEAFPAEHDHYGMGYTLPDAEGLRDGHRLFKDVKVHEVSPMPPFNPPAFPA